MSEVYPVPLDLYTLPRRTKAQSRRDTVQTILALNPLASNLDTPHP